MGLRTHYKDSPGLDQVAFGRQTSRDGKAKRFGSADANCDEDEL